MVFRVPVCTLPKTFEDYSRRAYRGDDLSVGELALVEGDVAAGEGGEGAQHQGAYQQHSNLRVENRVKRYRRANNIM
jgi:hypothetical protein